MTLPIDLQDTLGTIGGGLLVAAITSIVGTALYLRHRGRVSSDFVRKLETLRHSPAS
jgi:hypothetical protein